MLALAPATPGAAFHLGETWRVSYGTFTVHGTYSQRACSAQANLRSVTGANVSFSIYWRPGRSLHLITTHPRAGQAQGAPNMQFRFPDGQAVAFATSKSGNQLQTNIGFGGAAQRFYRMIEANGSVRIELPGINDVVDVSLAERAAVVRALFNCKDEFLHM